jgi:flagellar assembly factor FliW
MIQTSAVTGHVNIGIEAFIMLNQSASNDKASNEPRLVHSRFGEVMVEPTKAIQFTRGMLGIPDRLRFALVKFPSEKMQQFMLLQSLEEDALSFITLPVPNENAIIAHADVQMACKDFQIPEQNLALLMIVSVHRSPTQTRLSVNARAPLLIDAERKLGVQYVFQNDAYKIQHMLD